jgi:hypothetical protein
MKQYKHYKIEKKKKQKQCKNKLCNVEPVELTTYNIIIDDKPETQYELSFVNDINEISIQTEANAIPKCKIIKQFFCCGCFR